MSEVALELIPEEIFYEIQVAADGKTLWVHSSQDGSTVGRFSKYFGVDLHSTATAQLEGAPHCLKCTHGPAGPAEWKVFREGMLEHYGFEVPETALRFD